jgi:hypothetical protein
MSTRGISWWCKGDRCVGLITLPPQCADCVEIPGSSTSWSPEGLSRPVEGLQYIRISHREARRNAEHGNLQCCTLFLKTPCLTVEIRVPSQNVKGTTQSISRPPTTTNVPSSAVHNPSLYVIYTETEVNGIDESDSLTKQNTKTNINLFGSAHYFNVSGP